MKEEGSSLLVSIQGESSFDSLKQSSRLSSPCQNRFSFTPTATDMDVYGYVSLCVYSGGVFCSRAWDLIMKPSLPSASQSHSIILGITKLIIGCNWGIRVM